MQEQLESGSFTLIEDGKEVVYSTLFTFYNKDTNKNYVVYTDESEDENGNMATFASCYNPDDPSFNLLPVETNEEWENVESVLNTMFVGGENE